MKKISEQESRLSVRLLSIESTLTSSIIFMPVAYLLFADIGLNQFKIGLLQMSFAVAMLILQVPTGYLADKFSRKVSNFSGDIFLVIGMLIYFFAANFAKALAAEIIFAIGLSLTSGADAALLKGHAQNAKLNYRKLNARLGQAQFIAGGIGAVLGGFMGAHNIRWPFLVQATVFAIAGIFALFVKNIGEKRKSNIHPVKDVVLIIKFCVHGHPKLAWRIFLGASLFTSTWVIVWLLTPSFFKAGVPISFQGFLFGLISVAAVLGGQLYIKNPKLKMTTPFLFAFIAYLTLSLDISRFTILIFLMTSFARGINASTVKPYIQDEAPEDIQATVLSVFDMVFRVFTATCGFLVNWAGNKGVQYGMMAAAALTISMYFIFKFNRKRYE